MFRKKEKKTTTDVLFGKTVCNVPWNVRTQEKDQAVDSWRDVEDCILDMFADDNEFVTLTTADARYNIRYVQACPGKEGIIVQVGIEEGEHTRLVEKTCLEEECLDIFDEFYHFTTVQNLEQYKPVEFFV